MAVALIVLVSRVQGGDAPSFDVIEFPEADSETVGQWMGEADQVRIFEQGGHERVWSERRLTGSRRLQGELLATRFHFLPRDTHTALDAAIVGVEIRTGSTIRRWYWTEDHPSKVVGKLWGFLHRI
jgi:hypothetical protein